MFLHTNVQKEERAGTQHGARDSRLKTDCSRRHFNTEGVDRRTFGPGVRLDALFTHPSDVSKKIFQPKRPLIVVLVFYRPFSFRAVLKRASSKELPLHSFPAERDSQYAKVFLISFPRPKALRFIDFSCANAFDIFVATQYSSDERFNVVFNATPASLSLSLSLSILSRHFYLPIRSGSLARKMVGKKLFDDGVSIANSCSNITDFMR